MAFNKLFTQLSNSFSNKKENENTYCAFGFLNDGISFVRLSQHDANKKDKATPLINIEEINFLSGKSGLYPILIKQLAKDHKIKKTPCHTYLNNDNYQLLVAERPEVPDEDLINALRWEIKDLIALPIDDATLDTFYTPGKDAGKKSINVISASKKRISEIETTFSDAKLDIKTISIEELVLRNLALLDEQQKNGIVTLWLAENYGKILFIYNSELYLTRNIEKGYKAIANESQAMEIIAIEVQRSIDYFERHFNHAPIRSLLLMPIGINTSDFCSYLDKNLSLSSHELEIQEKISGLDNFDPEKIQKHLLTIGAGLNSALMLKKKDQKTE